MTTVTAENVDAGTAADLTATWATLPRTLQPTTAGPDLLALGGGSADWPERLASAAARGVRGIVLLDPSPVPARTVRELAASVTVPVVVQTTWTPNPALAQFRERWAPALNDAMTVRVVARHAGGRPVEHLLLDEFTLVRAAVGAITRVSFARLGEHGHALVGELDGKFVHLQGVRTAVGAGEARLAALGADQEHWLELPAPGTAAPARAAVSGPDGEQLLSPIHETGRRAMWRAVHRQLETGGTGTDLTALADDLDLVAAAVAQSLRC